MTDAAVGATDGVAISVTDGARYSVSDGARVSTEAEGFDAWDVLLDRPVTLAVEREHLAADRELHALHRAAIAARGRMPAHAGLPPLIDEGELEREGRKVIWTASARERGLPVDLLARPTQLDDDEWAQLVLHIAVQLADVLVATHRAGLVHGAVGPDTVLIGGDGEGSGVPSVRVALVDLGPQAEQVARLAALESRPGSKLWARWAATRLYPAPEVEAGHPPTPRSDVYGFGCVLATLLADQPELDWAELLSPPAHADVIRELRELADGCRNEKPANRPYSFLLILEKLSAIMAATAADERAFGLGSAVLEQAAERELPADLVALLAWVAERVPGAWLNRISGWRGLAARAGLPQRAERAERVERFERLGPPRVRARPERMPRRAPGEGTRRAQRTWVVVLSIVLVAGAIAGALFAHFAGAKDTAAASVVVPAVAGLSPSIATAELTKAGFSVGGRQDQHSTQPVGRVAGTDPTVGSHAARGMVVVLLVSSGPQLVALPSLVGSDQAAATAALVGAGLTVGTVSKQDGNATAGLVLSTSPANGSVEIGSAVNLVVASGRQRVPAGLVGADQATAITALRAAGFTTQVATVNSPTAPTGQVLSTSPASGGLADAGSVVRVTVSQLVPPTPSSEPTSSSTPSPGQSQTPKPGTSAPASPAPGATKTPTPGPTATSKPSG